MNDMKAEEHTPATERASMSPAGPAPATPAARATLNRRTVLAAATAAGIGVAAARLVAWADEPQFTPVPLTGTLANKTGLDWVSPLGSESARVAHLLRRATFGATADELEQARSAGYAKTVDRLLEEKPAEPVPFPGGDGASAEKPLNIGQLQRWWVDHMLTTPTPFAERMTLFWHGHFTSDFRKVGAQDPFIYWQNLTWRRYALSDLRTIVQQVTIDPAMLRYLDLGTSTGRSPNENYSRELMELFTMGPEAYTEDDVRAAAKALAGWRTPLTQAIIDANVKRQMMRTGQAPKKPPKADTVRTGIFERSRAYTGPAFPFLGELRVWDTSAVLDKIVAQDATAPFIVTKILTHFATPSPSDAYVARLAAGFRRSGYDVKTLMRDVFMSPEFVAAPAYRALIKTPTEFMINAAKALGDRTLGRVILGSASGMGQVLFDPPSVGGWPQNESWISSNTMLARANYVTAVVNTVKKLPPSASAHETHLDGVLSERTLSLLNQTGDDRRRWAVLFASPEFQLK